MAGQRTYTTEEILVILNACWHHKPAVVEEIYREQFNRRLGRNGLRYVKSNYFNRGDFGCVSYNGPTPMPRGFVPFFRPRPPCFDPIEARDSRHHISSTGRVGKRSQQRTKNKRVPKKSRRSPPAQQEPVQQLPLPSPPTQHGLDTHQPMDISWNMWQFDHQEIDQMQLQFQGMGMMLTPTSGSDGTSLDTDNGAFYEAGWNGQTHKTTYPIHHDQELSSARLFYPPAQLGQHAQARQPTEHLSSWSPAFPMSPSPTAQYTSPMHTNEPTYLSYVAADVTPTLLEETAEMELTPAELEALEAELSGSAAVFEAPVMWEGLGLGAVQETFQIQGPQSTTVGEAAYEEYSYPTVVEPHATDLTPNPDQDVKPVLVNEFIHPAQLQNVWQEEKGQGSMALAASRR